jgi:hypothetical protein
LTGNLAGEQATDYRMAMNTGGQASRIEPEKLKQMLHFRIERMNVEQLQLLHRVLLQIEAEEISDRLSEAFEQYQAQGKLRRVPELVQQFRTEHRHK